MKSIIIGNGLNIQFSGIEYLNQSIIKRALQKAENNSFPKEVYSTETIDWLKIIHSYLPVVLRGQVDYFAITTDEKSTLKEIKKRYNYKTPIHDIGIEDYILLSDLFLRKVKMDSEAQRNVRGVLVRLFLDSIYNEGKINEIYRKFPEKLKLYLNSFDQIFTTNYDRNIELACNREVLYLHGCFHIIDDVYDPDSFRNQLPDKPSEKTPIIKGYEYLFSNAIMGSSGYYKQFVGTMSEQANSALEKMCDAIKTKPHLKSEVEKWKDSDSQGGRNLYESIRLMSENPNLKYPLDYHISNLKELKGSVTFLGLSPYNDSHIFELLLGNPNVELIKYYYYDKSEKMAIEQIVRNKRLITKDVKEFWKMRTSS